MDPIRHSQLYLSGTTDRVSQLTWVSLADGSNSVLGYNAGNHLAPSYQNNVLLGTNVGSASRFLSTCVLIGAAAGKTSERLRTTVGIGYNVLRQAREVTSSTIIGVSAGMFLKRTAECVAIGYKCLQDVEDGSRDVILGAYGASSASNIGNVVMVGTAVGANAADLEGVVLIGHEAAMGMYSSTDTVAIGAETAQVFRGNLNTIVGAAAAQNVFSEYTTVVGSRNMNRRGGLAVQLSNSVIIGESIQFDTPLTTRILRVNDTILVTGTGSFYDSTHPFPDPFISFSGNGRVVYKIEESRNDTLEPSERSLRFFESLRLGNGLQYTTTWDIGKIDEQFQPVGTPPWTMTVSASSANTSHIQTAVSFTYQGNIVASKMLKTSTLPFSLSNVFPYVDITVTSADASLIFSGNVYQNGVLIGPDENGGVVSGLSPEDVVDAPSGFTLSNLSEESSRPSVLYWDLSSESGANAAAYTVVQHAQRVDASLVYETLTTNHPHTSSTGAVDVDRGNNVTDIILVNSAAGRTGNVSVSYDVQTFVANVSASAAFCLTHTSAHAGRFGCTLLEQYTMECTTDTIGANVFTVSLKSVTGGTLFDCTNVQLYGPFHASIQGAGVGVPIDISGVRQAAADVWAFLDVFMNVDEPSVGVQMRLRVRGYSSTGYLARKAPLISQEYYFTAQDPQPGSRSLLYDRSIVDFFVDSIHGVWSVRDIVIQTARYRPEPQFNNCVFLGSNFTVANIEDRSNVFLLSMGPSNTLMRGTPDVLEIFAPHTSIKGHLTIGDSPSNNYLAFRGVSGDGFLEQVPHTFIGERIYQPSTQKSELLLFKGDDPPGSELGPDRVRVLSGQFRVDVPVNVSNNVYQYPGITFDTVGNTSTQPVFASDSVSGTQFYASNSLPTLMNNNFVGFSVASNNLQLMLHVKGSDGTTRTATLSLS